MRPILRSLSCLSLVLLALIAVMASVSRIGQTVSEDNDRSSSEFGDASLSFCDSNNWNNWSADKPPSISELREVTIPPDGTLTVDGLRNGGIWVKGEERSDILVRACVQSRGKTIESAKRLASGIRINTSGTIKAENPDVDSDWSVSFDIRVPRSTNVDLTVENGGISITRVDGLAKFEVTNGGVFLNDVSGSFKGRTLNGGLFVRLSGTGWKGSGLDVISTNGGVNIDMPEKYAAHVEIGTLNGRFDSDFPGLKLAGIDGSEKQQIKVVKTDINGGGPTVRLVTSNGGVRIGTAKRGRSVAADVPPLTLNHAFIVVTTGAPERRALEKEGFRFAPTINRHDGQGTASITVELLNGFLELTYPDPTVPVSPAFQAGAEKFRLRSAWRETGYSPIAIVFNRTPGTPEKLPFATWKISPDWMEKGTFMEMLTPKEMPKAISLSIHPAGTSEKENEMLARDPVKGWMFLHPNGARRLTGLRVVAPSADALPPAASYIAKLGPVKFDVGKQWLLEVTLDNGKQRKTKNLEPDLPMVIHY